MFDGEVTQVRLNPTTESNVVTYEVIVAAANPEHKLIPGLTANLTIYITREKDILLVPNKAFLFNPKTDLEEDSKLPRVAEGVSEPETNESDERVVWLVKDNTLVPTLVKIGTTNGVNTQIISGLKEKDIVAIDYDSAAVASTEGEESSGETSPFAPQPPGKNKKK
jgi:HlyD family secretion protein